MRTFIAIAIFAFAVSAARAQDPAALAATQVSQQQTILIQQQMAQTTLTQINNDLNNSTPKIQKPFQLKLRSPIESKKQPKLPVVNVPTPARNSHPIPAATPYSTQARAPTVPYPYATNTVPYPYATNAAR